MDKWLKWAMEIQAVAQSGLACTDNVYDTERYERLRKGINRAPVQSV